MKLSIVIINYNTKELTLNCIDSLYKQYKTELEDGGFEIVLIDNASTDGSGKELLNLLKNKKGIVFIESSRNLGFGGGNNEAAKKAKGKYLLFLNSDTEVLDRGLIDMVDFLDKNEKIGVLGARLLNIDGSDQRSAVKFYNLFNLFLMLVGLERVGFLRSSPSKIKKVDWVSGASLMIRRDLFEKLNGFDKNLFMYLEDMELCFRVQKENFDVFFYPNIKIVHKERGSSNKPFAILNIYKGIKYFYKTHKPKWQYVIANILLKKKAIFALILGIISYNRGLINTYKEAIKI
ncbi:MAG: hypothetical protein A2W22_03550 [Candidatus Levybacteria bacterium RBG_16_35_11]|nr:MAG: hypothetical protein A2W22_03550 [Candidatus Levybacteria bacterium RBG_16_35_11]